MSVPTSTSLAIPTPSKTAGDAPVRRVNTLFSVASFGKASSRSGDSPEAVTSIVTLSDATVIFCDWRIVRCSGWWVHSDILGKILSFLPDSLQGVHVKSIPVIPDNQGWGMAVNASESLMAVSCAEHYRPGTDRVVFLHSLPSGKLLRRFGGNGTGPGRFDKPRRVCFGPDDVIIVADQGNNRLQEFSSTGEYKRSISVASPWAVCVSNNGNMIAAGGYATVVLFDYGSGAVILRKPTPNNVGAVCFSLDDKSVFFTCMDVLDVMVCSVSSGLMVRTIGASASWSWKSYKDVCIAPCGEIIVSVANDNRIHVFDNDGVTKKVEFGEKGGTAGTLNGPGTLCFVNGRLYVLNAWAPRVDVFE